MNIHPLILVHEAIHKLSLERFVEGLTYRDGKKMMGHLKSCHTTVEDIGKVSQEAGIKTLSLTHFTPFDDPQLADKEREEGARRYFDGDVMVSRYLLVI